VGISVVAKMPAGAEAGIAFSVTDAEGPRAMRALVVVPGEGGRGTARLVLATGSEERLLAGPVEAYARPGAWTRLDVWSDWEYVRAAVAGRIVLEAETRDRPAGRAGLIALGKGHVLFDDFAVRPWHVVRERRPGESMPWTAAPGGGGLVSPAIAWPLRDFRIGVRSGDGRAFPAVRGGEGSAGPLPAAEAWEEAAGKEDDPVACVLDVRGPHALLFADGRPRGEFVIDPTGGLAPGVVVSPGSRVAGIVLEPSMRPLEAKLFGSDFSAPVVNLPHGRGRKSVVGDFLRPAAGSWRCFLDEGEGFLRGSSDATGVIWLNRPCPGDCRIKTRLVWKGDPGFEQAGVALAAGRNEAGGLSRYTLSVEPRAARATQEAPSQSSRTGTEGGSAGGLDLVLRRDGEEAGRTLVTADREASSPDRRAGAREEGEEDDESQPETALSVRLERRGAELFCLAGAPEGEERVISWRDPQPLDGRNVGLFVREGRATFASASVTHLRAVRSDFGRVEPDWQPVSGEWRLHTGLACIPWDHWITAFGSEDGPAYMGLLWEPGEDVCIVLRCSEASEGFATRTHVHYPLHDVSVTLRGDLERPGRAGYRILVAPLPAKDTVVLFRNGHEVARERGFRIVKEGHCNQPRQFTMIARAEGGRVSCSINGREVLSFTDPDPLPAGRVLLGAERGRVNFADVTVMDVTPRGRRGQPREPSPPPQ
jgi:hypothetical protein